MFNIRNVIRLKQQDQLNPRNNEKQVKMKVIFKITAHLLQEQLRPFGSRRRDE